MSKRGAHLIRSIMPLNRYFAIMHHTHVLVGNTHTLSVIVSNDQYLQILHSTSGKAISACLYPSVTRYQLVYVSPALMTRSPSWLL